MIVSSLSLHNFRNYDDSVFTFDPHLTLIVGPNARGKTNILEALHFISTGKGLTEERKEELMLFGSDTTDVRLKCSRNDVDVEFKASLFEKDGNVQKAFFIDKAKKSHFSFTKESPPVVLFSPSFMNIIEGSPSKRRRFIDTLLSRIDIEYKKRLRNYENGMRKRNKVIEMERDEAKLREALEFWDTYLIEQADYISEKRMWFATYTQSHETFETHTFSLSYQPNVISTQTLEDSFKKQYYQRRTLVGPQRDEFRILKHKDGKEIDVHRYSSRGEQRLALLWLILHQLRIYTDFLDSPPILLLDDIFSELDDSNKGIIQKLVEEYQTVITSADEVPSDTVRTDTIIRL